MREPVVLLAKVVRYEPTEAELAANWQWWGPAAAIVAVLALAGFGCWKWKRHFERRS